MRQTPHTEDPNFPPPDTVVIDNPVAERMAHAAHPGYEKLLTGGRDLSINQAVAIGMEIGEAMETARHNVAKAVGPEAVGHAVAAPEAVELPSYGYGETKRTLFEQNVETLQNTVASIFNTIRGKEGYPEGHEEETPAGLRRSEKITVYDPDSGTTNLIHQTLLYDKAGGSRPVEQTIFETTPVDHTETPAKLLRGKAEGRLLIKGRYMKLDEQGVEEYRDQEILVSDKKPEDVIAWSTRIARSFPLSDPLMTHTRTGGMRIDPNEILKEKGIKAPYYHVAAAYREPILDKDLKKALDADRERFEALKAPPRP